MGGQSSLSEFVLYEQRGPIAILTLDRPSKRNALDTNRAKLLNKNIKFLLRFCIYCCWQKTV